MAIFRRTMRRRCLLLSAMLALLVFIDSIWLTRRRVTECGSDRQPCFHQQTSGPGLAVQWEERSEAPPLQECPGQSFQVSRLLQCLKSSLWTDDDVLLEPYLQSWDQLIRFMESLGPMVTFFSQKVQDKVSLIRRLSLQHRGPAPQGQQTNGSAYRSARSMVRAELQEGVVDFSQRTDSGCRTLLRLHRSLLWLKLLLQGLTYAADEHGRLKTPGELSREAYRAALAPHHPWMLRRAAELVFLALPDRKFFLELVCVRRQQDAVPVLQLIVQALEPVHVRTQRILEEHHMLDLP